MKRLLKSRKMWIFLISIITTICISLNVINGQFYFEGNDYRWILLIAVLCILLSKAKEKYNKRLLICTGAYSLIISCFVVIGYTAIQINDFPINKKDLVLLMCKFEACFVVLTSIMIIIFRNIPNAIERIKNINCLKEYKFFTANKKSIFVVAGVILLAYIPYVLNYFPGSVLTDSVVQTLQAIGKIPLTNHHPVLHTEIIAICMRNRKSNFWYISSRCSNLYYNADNYYSISIFY